MKVQREVLIKVGLEGKNVGGWDIKGLAECSFNYINYDEV